MKKYMILALLGFIAVVVAPEMSATAAVAPIALGDSVQMTSLASDLIENHFTL